MTNRLTLIVITCCLTGHAQGQVAQTPAAQTPAAKKPAAARVDPFQAAYAKTLKQIRDSRDAAAKATTDKEKAAALQRAAAAQKALVEIARKRRETMMRMNMQARGYPYAAAVRKQVDPGDTKERFLVLMPSGPLLLEASMTLDGKPFRTVRERHVKQLMKIARDTAEDSDAPKWTEALKQPRFMMGRIRVTNGPQRESSVRRFDVNGDRVVDEYEVRSMLAALNQGPAFQLLSGGGGNRTYQAEFRLSARMAGGQSSSPTELWGLLDGDQDEVLSEKEIAGAVARLRRADANSDELLQINEIQAAGSAADGTPATPQANTYRGGYRAAPPQAVLLGPAATPASIWDAIKAAYAPNKERLATRDLHRDLAAKLDTNGDQEVSVDEVAGLNSIAPDAKLLVRLGNTKQPRLSISVGSDDLTLDRKSSTRTIVLFAGNMLAVQASDTRGPAFDYAGSVKQLMNTYDKNKDQYLTKDELTNNNRFQFDVWDANGDGKAYEAEIVEAYNRMTEAMWSRVRATVNRDTGPLYHALDLNGDGQLGARDVAGATAAINRLDKNGDGMLRRQEAPRGLDLQFATGATRYGYTRSSQVARPAAQAGPDWFRRMDRNGDGDVSLKEFLGTPEAFKELDANNDDFVDRREAERADAEQNGK